ncbi:hypothetical protein BGY98DRAFT_1019443, partial [Russula aff. rugulosa BPL654]
MISLPIMCALFSNAILYGPLTSVVTRFLFRLLQRFSFLLPTECLLLFGCHVPGFWIFL